MKLEIIHINPIRASVLVSSMAVACAAIYWVISFLLGVVSGSFYVPGVLHIQALLMLWFATFCSTYVSCLVFNFLGKHMGGFQFETKDQSAA